MAEMSSIQKLSYTARMPLFRWESLCILGKAGVARKSLDSGLTVNVLLETMCEPRANRNGKRMPYTVKKMAWSPSLLGFINR